MTCTIASANPAAPLHLIFDSIVAASFVTDVPPGIPPPANIPDQVENADDEPLPMMIGFWIA